MLFPVQIAIPGIHRGFQEAFPDMSDPFWSKSWVRESNQCCAMLVVFDNKHTFGRNSTNRDIIHDNDNMNVNNTVTITTTTTVTTTITGKTIISIITIIITIIRVIIVVMVITLIYIYIYSRYRYRYRHEPS